MQTRAPPMTMPSTAPGTAAGRPIAPSFPASFRDLNVDEQIDLVAMMWLGRGDGDLDNWNDLRSEASRAHNNRTASYLVETPMLADYLEEALSQFGMSPEEFEEPL